MHVLTTLYLCSYADLIILCGDFNSRIGKEKDYVNDMDIISERKFIDTSINSHGKLFLEFLKDSKLCVVNGRVNVNADNYTFLSTRGRSVVDYFCVPHECLPFVTDFQVLPMNDIVDEHNLYMLTSDLCRIPDHYILYGKFKLSYIENCTLPPKVSNEMSHTESDLKSFNQLHKRYKVNPISENFI